MNVICTHLAAPTLVAGQHHCAAQVLASAKTATQAAGILVVVVMIVVAGFVAAVVRATRLLTALFGQFLQVASSMTATLCTMVITVLVVVALLVHH